MQLARASLVLWGRLGAAGVGKGRQAAVKGGDDWPLRYTIWGSNVTQVKRKTAENAIKRLKRLTLTLKASQGIIFTVLTECIS